MANGVLPWNKILIEKDRIKSYHMENRHLDNTSTCCFQLFTLSYNLEATPGTGKSR